MPIARLLPKRGQFESLADEFGHALMRAGVAASDIRGPTMDGQLVEIEARGEAGAVLVTVAQEFFSDADVLVAPNHPGVPDLFISDMDSTMIGQECIDELADYAGIKPQIAEITERAMQGELDFESALRERVALLAGLEESAIGRCLEERIRPMDGARVLVQTLRSMGCRTVLVTGGFHHFADRVAAQLGFEHVVANGLETSNGKLTGGLVGPIVDSSVKRSTLETEMRVLGEGASSLATGDGANDIPMIEAATYGIAYHAKPKARAAANGWISQGDLTSVLTLLGIPEEDWIEG